MWARSRQNKPLCQPKIIKYSTKEVAKRVLLGNSKWTAKFMHKIIVNLTESGFDSLKGVYNAAY